MLKVEKTDRLDQQKPSRMQREYGVSPISIKELQLGHIEELPDAIVYRLERDGYVKRIRVKPRLQQKRADVLTTENTESVITIDDTKIETIEDVNGITCDSKEEKEQI